MSEQSPITPSDLGAISDGLLACDALRELLNTRTKMQTFLQWFLQDNATGLLGDDFKLALTRQLLFDVAKNGWVAMSNDSTGFLELREFLPIASLDPTGASDDDTIVFASGQWIIAPHSSIYTDPSTPATVPLATVGGVFSVAHGLGAAPTKFEAILECNTADAGYAIADRVDALSLIYFNGVAEVQQAVTVSANATTVSAVFRNGGAGAGKVFQLLDKATFDRGTIVPASWDIKLYAAI